jgi:sugar O-acyltransferase (sialic acid O-acetyltransferase NeuD family)
MKKIDLLLIGAGGHAAACIDVIESIGDFNIVGIVGLPSEIGSMKLGYEVIGSDADLITLGKKYSNCIITLGQIKSPESRINLFNKAKKAGFAFPSIISKRAYLSSHANIGEGTILMHDSLVNAGAVIGRNCIINTKALIEHDSKIGDNCHVSTGVVVNGATEIGDNVFIGSASTVRNSLKIGSGVVIGMGSTVLSDLDSNTTYLGLPRK